MSISADRDFAEGEPSSSEYVWVIERARGCPDFTDIQFAVTRDKVNRGRHRKGDLRVKRAALRGRFLSPV